MGATRTYGIPRVVESAEIFSFNEGKGKLKIRFTGGIPDPKYRIPATYSTSNEFEQLVIESSPQFGHKIFRYGPKGTIIASSVEDIVANLEAGKKEAPAITEKGRRGHPAITRQEPEPIPEDKIYNNVETIGDATEVLLDLGVKADELTTPESVVAAMMKLKVSFPNLKLN